MDSDEYRQHARLCRRAAERSTDPIRSDFLAAADIWDMLARQFDFLIGDSADRDRPEPHPTEIEQRAHGR